MPLAARLDLHHGNAMDVLAQMPADSVDLVLSNPAYGISHTRMIPGTNWDASSLAFDPALVAMWCSCSTTFS